MIKHKRLIWKKRSENKYVATGNLSSCYTIEKSEKQDCWTIAFCFSDTGENVTLNIRFSILQIAKQVAELINKDEFEEDNW